MYVSDVYWSLAERIGSGLIFENYGKHAAFLAEEVDLWFIGGIDDMAINTQWKWTRMIEELEGKNETKKMGSSDFIFRRDFPDYFKMKPEILKKYGDIIGLNVKELGEKGIEIGLSKNLSSKAYKELISEIKKDLNITIKESQKAQIKPNKPKLQKTSYTDS